MIQHKTFNFAVKSLDDAGAFTLYAAVFGNEDRQGDIIEPGAFRNLAEFARDGWGALNHRSSDLPVAMVDSAAQDATGLKVSGRFHSHQAAQDCRTVVKERQEAGKSVKCSIGYTIDDAAMETRGGKTVRLLKSLDVYEFSFVNLPANPRAEVTEVKGSETAAAREAKVNQKTALEKILAALGLSTKAGRAISEMNRKRLEDVADAMEDHHKEGLAHCKTMHEHLKEMKEHHEEGRKIADELHRFVKAAEPPPRDKEGEDDDYEDDDDDQHEGPSDRGDVERDDEGDEEVVTRRRRKPAPAKSADRALTIYREQLRHRATAGRVVESCP